MRLLVALDEVERLQDGIDEGWATSEDVEAAIDQALIETPLFDELWRQRTDDERRVLRLLAAGREVDEDDSSVVKGLVREGYVLRGEGIAVPMFASWIVENA